MTGKKTKVPKEDPRASQEGPIEPSTTKPGNPDEPSQKAGKTLDPAELRRRAETLAPPFEFQDPETISHEEARRALQDLRVHQIELELQNEELRRAQVELDTAYERYFNLYNLAPVGYLTVSEKGLILEGNLTAATLLGVDRGNLVLQPLTKYILPADQDVYYLHRKKLFETGGAQECDLRMAKHGEPPFWAHLQASLARDTETARRWRVVFSDISARKQVEEELAVKAAELNRAFEQIRTLRGIVPICSGCKKIRDDRGFWQQVEVYVRDHTEAEFSHGLCPDCLKRLYPDCNSNHGTNGEDSP